MRIRAAWIAAVICAGGASSTTTGSTRTSFGGNKNGLVRIWIQYKAGVTHEGCLQSLRSNLIETFFAADPESDSIVTGNSTYNATVATNVTDDDELLIQELLEPDHDGLPLDGDENLNSTVGTDEETDANSAAEQGPGGAMRRRRRLHLPAANRPRWSRRAEAMSQQFRLHYDFFDLGIGSVSLTASRQLLRALSNDPRIETVRRDPRRHPLRPMIEKAQDTIQSSTSNTTTAAMLRRRHLFEQLPYGIATVKAAAAWRKGFRGQGVTVCVIDTGLDLAHPEYSPIEGWTGVSTRKAGSWTMDGYGHGTHVTGILAARRNGIGVVGVAPAARIVSVKVFDARGRYVYASSVAGAAMQCRRLGAKVINMSLGGAGYSQQENDVYERLLRNGTVSVAAAGNRGSTEYFYPAAYRAVVSVAAIDSRQRAAYFSQRNDRVDLAAPGVSVYSTLPVKQGTYGFSSGTSMASPHVAGVAALLFSKKPSASGAAVVSALTSSATDLGSRGYDTTYGHGLVSAAAAIRRL